MCLLVYEVNSRDAMRYDVKGVSSLQQQNLYDV